MIQVLDVTRQRARSSGKVIDEISNCLGGRLRNQRGHGTLDLYPCENVTEHGGRACGRRLHQERARSGQRRLFGSSRRQSTKGVFQTYAGGEAENSPLVRVCAGTVVLQAAFVLLNLGVRANEAPRCGRFSATMRAG